MTAGARPRVLVVAREPGAASALAPVARQCSATVIAFHSAIAVFEREGIDTLRPESDDAPGFADECIARMHPDVVLTGTSRRELAPRDHAWWRAARAYGIPSVALLDHWLGYTERFSAAQPFDAVPGIIAVMDDYARDRLVALGAHDTTIVVTGQPALDSAMAMRLGDREPDARVALFVSEPIAADLGNARGYDENTVLGILLHALDGTPWRLVVKPHPRELADCRPERSEGPAFLPSTLSGREAIASANVVVGMTSVLLLESALAGLPVLSIQPASREPWTDHFQTLITTVESLEGARAWLGAQLHRPALTPAERSGRIRSAGFDERGTATENVCRLLRTLSA